MEYSIDDFKLKHLHLVTNQPDLATFMTDVFGYKNTWIDRRIMFKYKAKRILPIVQQLMSHDISKSVLTDKCKIRNPKSVDSLSFQCRLEIGNIKGGDDNMSERIIDIITLACYSTHHKATFNSDSNLFYING